MAPHPLVQLCAGACTAKGSRVLVRRRDVSVARPNAPAARPTAAAAGDAYDDSMPGTCRGRRRTAACSAGLGLAMGLLGCGHPATPPPDPGAPAPASAPALVSPAASPSLTPAPPPGVVRLTERDNHTTVTVPVGTRLDVTLASTYWSLSSSSPAMLQTVGAARYPRGACRPGAGCGSTQLTMLTRTGGTSDVVGLRTSCGEAVRCTAATGRYLVNVHVLARRP